MRASCKATLLSSPSARDFSSLVWLYISADASTLPVELTAFLAAYLASEISLNGPVSTLVDELSGDTV